ncbi:hypothetical protein DRN79_02410 [Methanosarcinales archaeon]|nr:MAG: hypothetical protein DRN79_02410 [Methanosarcinales archaeon]
MRLQEEIPLGLKAFVVLAPSAPLRSSRSHKCGSKDASGNVEMWKCGLKVAGVRNIYISKKDHIHTYKRKQK